MKTRLNKFLSIILVAVMLLSALPFTASAEELSGTCGYNLSWTLDTETGELSITGTGAMYNYSDLSAVPWYRYRSSINKVTIGNGVTNIGVPGFSSCANLTSFMVDENNNTYSSDEFGVLFNKDKTVFIRYPTGNERTSYTIPNSVTTIGDYAFYGSVNLTSVTIPDSVTIIGDCAFMSFYNLESVFLPESISFIGGNAFSFSGDPVLYYPGTPSQWDLVEGYAADFRNNVVCESNSERPYYAPGKCGENLTYILYTDGEFVVTGTGAMNDYSLNLDGEAPWNYSKRSLIKTVVITDGVTTVGSYAFYDCSNLKSATISDSVTTIGNRAFSDCSNITQIIVGNSVATIGDNAFARCPNLEEVMFTNSGPVSLGNNLFDSSPKAMICCEAGSWLHSYADANDMKVCIIDDSGVPGFEIKNEVLVSYRGDSEYVFLDLVTKIGYGAFENNSTVKNIEVGKGITTIYNNAFKGCTELESVIIPQSITFIGATAFDGCDGVTIWCYRGSYADEYAQANGIDVEYITLQMDKDVVYLNPNGTMTLTYTFNMPLAENVSVTWESTDKSVVTVDAYGNIKGVKAGTAVVVASSRDGSMRDYCVVKVVGIEALSTVTIDYDNGFITGIESNTTSLDGLIAMTDSTCSLSYTTLGTDSVVYVQRENEIVDAYTVLIFGDVNGDGWYDGTDSIIVSCLANGLLTQDSVSEAVYRAADCNHDGVIDSFDVAILEQAGLLLSGVDQSKSNEELATDAAFIEYLDLIDQTPDEEDVEDEVIETPETEEFDLIEFIITIIKKFFELLLSTLPIK